MNEDTRRILAATDLARLGLVGEAAKLVHAHGAESCLEAIEILEKHAATTAGIGPAALAKIERSIDQIVRNIQEGRKDDQGGEIGRAHV